MSKKMSKAAKQFMEELKNRGLSGKYDAEKEAIISGNNIFFPMIATSVESNKWTFWWIGIEGKGFQATFVNCGLEKYNVFSSCFKYSELRNVEKAIIMHFKKQYDIDQDWWEGMDHGASILANSKNCDDCKKIVSEWDKSTYENAKKELKHLRDFKSKHGMIDNRLFL